MCRCAEGECSDAVVEYIDSRIGRIVAEQAEAKVARCEGEG